MEENVWISIGNQDKSGDAFVAVAKVRHSIIPLGGRHGVEVIDYGRLVRPIPWCGTRARRARGGENGHWKICAAVLRACAGLCKCSADVRNIF